MSYSLSMSDRVFPALTRATARHAAWARDYIAVGDFDSAIEALCDACDARAEQRIAALDAEAPMVHPAARADARKRWHG